MTGTLAVAEAGRAAAGELRVSERFPCDVPASCQPPSDWKRGGQKWTARVRDISTGGLCLVLGRRFERGAGLAIEVPGADDDSPSTLLARVMYVRAEGPGAWALGCAFVSPLSDEELHALVQSAIEEAPPVAPTSVADVAFFGKLSGGRVVRRRIRKLRPNGQWPLAAGQSVGLRFRAKGGVSVAQVRVDACRAAGASWVLECTFLAPPPDGMQ